MSEDNDEVQPIADLENGSDAEGNLQFLAVASSLASIVATICRDEAVRVLVDTGVEGDDEQLRQLAREKLAASFSSVEEVYANAHILSRMLLDFCLDRMQADREQQIASQMRVLLDQVESLKAENFTLRRQRFENG